MSKKHFIELADMIRDNREHFTQEAIDALAKWCKAQNPGFMPGRWFDYIDGKCGPGGGAIKAAKGRDYIAA